jgi:medium-chain acyl-[acyl-carrier-protein] hydrolase
MVTVSVHHRKGKNTMKYSFQSRVRFSEVDENADLTLTALINYLQDCATFHGEAGRVGVYWIKENRKSWVLASLRLHILEYPKFAEEIITSTWATGFRSFLGYRDFTIERPDGTLLAAGKSDWVFLDQKTGDPCEVTQEQIEGYGIEPQLALEDVYGKRKVRLPKEGKYGNPFVIQESHLDTNHHVNNGQYMVMAQNYLPIGFHVRSLRAEYRKQAFLGDEVRPFVSGKDGAYIIALLSRKNEPFFIGEFT